MTSGADERIEELTPGSDRKGALLETLRRRIMCLRLKPGAVLDEAELGREFGLSRSPVRELLRQMAAEGYVELEANRAPRVASLSHDALRNFYLAAPVVYIATTRLAAAHATPSDIEELKHIQADFKASVASGNIDERVFSNDRFHDAIGRMARNPYWMPTLHRLQIDHARLAKTFYQPHDSRMVHELAEAIRQHDEIIEAIEQRDADRASDIVRAHLELSRQNLAMYVAPSPDTVLQDIASDRPTASRAA